jgi:multiple sugar transport system substrate-binding protein
MAAKAELFRARNCGYRKPTATPQTMKLKFFPCWLAVLAASAGVGFAELPHFNNVTVTVIGDAGQNMESFNKYADDFSKAGITIKQVGATFTGLYDKLKTSFVAGSDEYDMVIFYPSYIGDFAGNGYLEPLDQYMKKTPDSIWDPKLDEVEPPYREVYCKWAGKTYALPYDGDVLVLYYRKDLFDNPDEKAAFQQKFNRELAPPTTWKEWLQVAEFFTRKPGDTLAGQKLDHPFYGAGEYGARGFSYGWFLARFASAGGIYFDENMNPQINTPAAVEGLQNMVDTLKFCPTDVLGYGYTELKDAFLNGDLAMVVQWSDVGKKTADPQLSKVVGKVGFAVVPGTEVSGQVQHKAPMPVGRVLAVPAKSKNKEAAYWVAKYLSLDKSPITVAANWSGQDPYRISHFTDTSNYKFPDEASTKAYVAAVEANLKNGFPDLNIPGAAQYIDALDVAVTKALSGEADPKTALDGVAADWKGITDRLGADNQKKFWKDALTSYRSAGLLK